MSVAQVEKVIRGGKVAVLYSPSFGAGWSTWNGEHEDFLLFDRTLVEAFESGGGEAVAGLVEALLPDVYTGGAGDLELAWLDEGERFYVHEYDGSESIKTGTSLIKVA